MKWNELIPTPRKHLRARAEKRIEVKPGNMRTLHGWSQAIPVRIIKRPKVNVSFEG